MFSPESDGLRIIRPDGTYFLERVPDAYKKTFLVGQVTDSASMIDARKLMDFKNPRADSKVRSVANIERGVMDLVDAAAFEYHDSETMKHLLRTASFAKNFTEP